MSQLDPQIPLGVKPVQIESPMNALMQYAQIQGAQQQNALASMKMEELQRARTQDETVRTGIQSGADPAQVLLNAGRVNESLQFSKGKREKEKADLEAAMQRLQVGAQLLSTARDQPSYDASRQAQAEAGLDVSRLPAQYDPNFVATKLKQSQTVHQQMEEAWKKADFGLRERTQASTEQHQRATEQTAAGQLAVAQGNLGVSQANLGLRKQEMAANVSKPFEVTGPDGQAVLVQQDKAGNITPVQGYAPKGGGKPLPAGALKQITEARDNANTIDRLEGSFKDEFASKGVMGLGAEASMGAKAVLGTDRDAVDWWKNYRKQAELIERHALFGASLTPGEQGSWRSADISPGMDKEVIKANLKERARLTKQVLEFARQDLVDAGHNPERINAIAGRGPGTNPTAPPPAAPTKPGAPVKISSDAEFNSLPSGATFIGPDGKTRRKP